MLKIEFFGSGLDQIHVNLLDFDAIFLLIKTNVQRLCSSLTRNFLWPKVICGTVFLGVRFDLEVENYRVIGSIVCRGCCVCSLGEGMLS